MKRTPRYIRLAVLGLGLVGWQLALSFERYALDTYLDGYTDSLTLFSQVSQATTALTIVSLTNVVWLFTPQEKRTN
jgi:hypothetical protein